ncbi:hypothetical protein KC354_g6635 [Hortaea werneckii]|nr:hypothetical protein KC354_g6635 [Hortaea werneckii]
MELPVRTRTNSAAFATKEQEQVAAKELQPQQVSAKEPQQQQKKRAPRTTFLVLPRELRNQIYGYLLSHEYTKMPPYHTRPAAGRGRQSEANKRDLSAAHTYRFHVNILAVNKQINREAAEELLLRNTFVVVSWEWDGLGDLLNKFDIPIITDNQKAVAKFKMHALRLHLKHPHMRGSIQSLLMLHSDLGVFCRTIRYLNATQDASGLFTLKLKDEFKSAEESGYWFLPFSSPSDPVFCTKVQFKRVTADSEEEVAIKKAKLLVPFADLRIGTQNLKIIGSEKGDEGSVPSKTVDDLIRLAAPALIWLKILAWDLFDITLGLMAAANELCREGEYARAREHYKAICSASAVKSTLLAPGLAAPADQSDAAVPVILALRVLVDAATAAGWLYLRESCVGNNFDQAVTAEDFGHAITAQLSQLRSKQEVLGYFDEMQLDWLYGTPYWHFSLVVGFLSGVLDRNLVVHHLQHLHTLCPDNAYVAHDLDEVTRLQNVETLPPARRKRLAKLFSVCVFPPQTFLFKIPEGNERPTNFEGWCDLEQNEVVVAALHEYRPRSRESK